MAGAHIEEVGAEQILLTAVTDLHLSYSDKVLVFADVVREAFVTKGVDFASDNKTVCPNFNEHSLNIRFFKMEFAQNLKILCFFAAKEYFI